MKEKEAKRKYKEEGKKENTALLVLHARTKGRPSKDRLDANRINWTAFVNYFNSVMDFHNSTICRIHCGLGAGQKRRLQYLANEWGKGALVKAITMMAASDVCNGRCPRVRWKASLHWLIGSNENFEKVLNGYYDNPPPVELSPEEERQLELERYKAREAERRAEARRIEEEESARREAARDYAARHCVTYEQYLRMKEKEANS